MSNYTWHQVTEQEKQEIKESSKKLLDDFSKKLSKISVKEIEQNEKENLRPQGSGWKTNEEFREFMFENAPLVEDGFIMTDKGKWKK